MPEIRYYVSADGRSPFEDWFEDVDRIARAKIAIAVRRLGEGNESNVKVLSQGVLECKIDFGPGYRIYFGRDGDRLIVLLVGGTKKRQNRDIAYAADLWNDYKRFRRVRQ